MAVPVSADLGLAAALDRANRRRHLLWGAGMLALFLGGQTFWRKLYYGEWLPMTYYLKMTGLPLLVRLWRGRRCWSSSRAAASGRWCCFRSRWPSFAATAKCCWLALVFLAQVRLQRLRRRRRLGASRRGQPLHRPGDAGLLLSCSRLAAWHVTRWFQRAASRLLPRFAPLAHPLGGLGLAAFLLLSVLMMNRLVDNGNPISQPAQSQHGRAALRLAGGALDLRAGQRALHARRIDFAPVTAPGARIAVVAAGSTPISPTAIRSICWARVTPSLRGGRSRWTRTTIGISCALGTSSGTMPTLSASSSRTWSSSCA